MTVSIRSAMFLASLALPLAAFAAPRNINACTAITESGSYILTRNVNATGDCMRIQADFVTVDLDGFVITGNGTGAAFAEVLTVGHGGIAIRNGTITGFVNAVALSHSSAVSVDRVHATANSGNAIVMGDTGRVTNSMILNNGGLGILAGVRAIVTDNTVNENGGTGISVGFGGNITGNGVGRNQVGIFTDEGGLVVNNVSRNNRAQGILMECPGAAIANTTSQNLAANFEQFGGGCDPNLGPCCVVNEHNSTLSAF